MLSTVLPYVALLFAIAALGVAYVAMQFALRNKRDERTYRTVLMHVAELEDLHEALAASHKRLRSRVGMRELRAKRKNGEDDEPQLTAVTDAEAWKREMRLKLHAGKLKP